MMAGGKDGTEISNVSTPTSGWIRANQSNNLCRGCKNQKPLPANGSVPGGRLDNLLSGCLLLLERITYRSLFPLRLMSDLCPCKNHNAMITRIEIATVIILGGRV